MCKSQCEPRQARRNALRYRACASISDAASVKVQNEEFKARWGYDDDEVAGSHMVSRSGWTDEEHRAGRRLPRPEGSLGTIVELTPEGNLELGADSAEAETGDASWSEA